MRRAKALAGNKCPPVPPAASSTTPSGVLLLIMNASELRLKRHAAYGARQHLVVRSTPRQRHQHAHGERRSDGDEPPWEINGRVMPLDGIRLRLTARLIMACNPNRRQPRRRQLNPMLALGAQPRQCAQHNCSEHADNKAADQQPPFGGNREHNPNVRQAKLI